MITEFFENNNLPLKNKTIVLAVSGGPDSMALTDLFNQIKKEQHLKLIVAHFNHLLRSDSSKETELIKAYCQKNELQFEEGTWVKENHPQTGIEAAARKARYAYLDQIVHKYAATYLVTAHHGDDLLENILLKFIRSGNPEEMNSLKAVSQRDNYLLIRPLLDLSKQDLLSYVKEKKIEYINDSTNFEDDTLRNRLRHHVVPLLKKENSHLLINAHRYCNELQTLTTAVQNDLTQFTKPVEFFNNVYRVAIADLPAQAANQQLYLRDFIWQKFHRRVNAKLGSFHQITYQDELYLFENLPQVDPLKKVKVGQEFNFLKEEYVISNKGDLANEMIGDFWALSDHFYVGSLPAKTKLPLKNGQHAKAKKMFAQAKIPAQLRYLCLSVLSLELEPIYIDHTYQDQRFLKNAKHYYIYKLKISKA